MVIIAPHPGLGILRIASEETLDCLPGTLVLCNRYMDSFCLVTPYKG